MSAAKKLGVTRLAIGALYFTSKGPLGTPVGYPKVCRRPLMLNRHAGLALAALATLQCSTDNPTFTSSSDQAERPERCPTMEDEAGTASAASIEASG